MTAFDLFQLATCQIAEGQKGAAAMTLTKAIRKIDADGIDAYMRADLDALRRLLILKVA